MVIMLPGRRFRRRHDISAVSLYHARRRAWSDEPGRVATNRKSAHRRLFFNHVRPSIENARLLMMAARAMDLCCARLRGCTK